MSNLTIWRERLELLLILVGIGIATYLSYVKLFGLEAYCAGVGDCEAVQTSPYALFLGIPVALLGLGGYFALLAIFVVKQSDWAGWGHLAEQVFFLSTLIGVLFSAYLTYLELFVILAVCPWCVASAVVIVLLFVLSLTEVLGLGEDYEEELTMEQI
jgi:uncharacterized membrane protein